MLERIMAHLAVRKELTVGELLYSFRADVSKTDLDIIVTSLEKMGLLNITHTGTTVRLAATRRLLEGRMDS